VGQKLLSRPQNPTSVVPPKPDIDRRVGHVRSVPILLQKSKIERCRKSRERGFLDVPTAAIPCSADAKVRGHFCAKHEVPHIASYETNQRSQEISIATPKRLLQQYLPQGDSCTAANDGASFAHSINSSARCWSCKDTSRPSAFAVLRLITRSNFVGNCTGNSAGFAPLRTRST
jgi:hypothetical protein